MTSAKHMQLGSLARARGAFGPAFAHASEGQMQLVTETVQDVQSYSADLENCIICIDDRLGATKPRKHAPRLAGGAVSLGLMYHLLYGGETLSGCLYELKQLGFYLVIHSDCGALQLAPSLIPDHLSSVDADGYKILEALGIETDVPTRERITTWATALPDNFFDVDEAKRVVHEVEVVAGQHNAAAAAVSLRDGESFVAGPELSERTKGLLAFGFDPWAAKQVSLRIGVALQESLAAERLAQLFTVEALLQLAADDLELFIHE